MKWTWHGIWCNEGVEALTEKGGRRRWKRMLENGLVSSPIAGVERGTS